MLNFGRRPVYKGEEFGVERVVGELGVGECQISIESEGGQMMGNV